ncbi:hypothetical protein [Microbacterium sp. bgisy189]|uniref:hypothetical protein n=1 Tax=Microbacterium sp. bgisy189 TaxID=3413798 RepID=UPI003EC049A3
MTWTSPADATAGPVELRATGTALFDVEGTGSTAASVVALSQQKYFVDCSATGAGDGTQDAPYTSTAQVNEHGAFLPGESILFRAGIECVGALIPDGSGVIGHPPGLDARAPQSTVRYRRFAPCAGGASR